MSLSSSDSSSMWDGVDRDTIDEHPEYQEAVQFRKSFLPAADADYRWVSSYAQFYYLQQAAAFYKLDEKADTIIRQLTGGTGLCAITMVALSLTKAISIEVVAFFIPALVFAYVAVTKALAARSPRYMKTPPPVTTAIHYVEYGDFTNPEATFLGHWHSASTGMKVAADMKADLVSASYRYYLIAVFCLLMPLLGSFLLRTT